MLSNIVNDFVFYSSKVLWIIYSFFYVFIFCVLYLPSSIERRWTNIQRTFKTFKFNLSLKSLKFKIHYGKNFFVLFFCFIGKFYSLLVIVFLINLKLLIELEQLNKQGACLSFKTVSTWVELMQPSIFDHNIKYVERISIHNNMMFSINSSENYITSQLKSCNNSYEI